MITLTHEEAQQVLDDLKGEIPFYSENDCNTPEWITNAIELLSARLSAPEPEQWRDAAYRALDTMIEIQAQPEPEPVAWMNEAGDIVTSDESHTIGWRPLYTNPPQREWQGLTRGDADSLRVSYTKNGVVQVDAMLMRVDEMLRERNT